MAISGQAILAKSLHCASDLFASKYYAVMKLGPEV